MPGEMFPPLALPAPQSAPLYAIAQNNLSFGHSYSPNFGE